jgi:hypothetical protein
MKTVREFAILRSTCWPKQGPYGPRDRGKIKWQLDLITTSRLAVLWLVLYS